MDELKCINNTPPCQGEVKLHSYGGRLKCFPRCELHHQMRLVEQQKIEARYPINEPNDFDPSYAGERW